MDKYETMIGKKIEDMSYDEFNEFWELKYGDKKKNQKFRKTDIRNKLIKIRDEFGIDCFIEGLEILGYKIKRIKD